MEKKFYAPFLSCLKESCILSAIFFIILCLFYWIGRNYFTDLAFPLLRKNIVVMGGIVVAGPLFAAVMMYAALRLSPCVLTTGSIRCGNRFGIAMTLEWASIEKVTRFNILGIRFIVLHGSGKQLWLPLVVTCQNKFIQTVEQFAGEKHAIMRLLKRQEP